MAAGVALLPKDVARPNTKPPLQERSLQTYWRGAVVMKADAGVEDQGLRERMVACVEAQWEPFRRTACTGEAFQEDLTARLPRLGQAVAVPWMEPGVAAEGARTGRPRCLPATARCGRSGIGRSPK
jgi:hypothetical protein